MSEQLRVPEAHDEPDLLRDQFRQLIRYRALFVAGVLIGLLGGGYLALSGADTYVATSEVVLRTPTVDPFAAGSGSANNQINIGSERQTAMSNEIAKRAAKTLGEPDNAAGLQSDLQVTNPPNTLVLRFAYTSDSPRKAARRANAFTKAYLDARQDSTKATIKNMVHGFQRQLNPVVEQRRELDARIESMGNGRTLDTATTVQATLVGRISELSSRITEIQALDTTPGAWLRVATPPSAPSGPGLPMMLGLGAVVGVAIGLLAAWVRLVFDPTARSEGDVVRALRAPVLGTVPRTRSGPLLAVGHADSRRAEEYRSVAFRLAYDQRFADRRRLLVVEVRGAGETAAAVSVNLAASFAEMGMEVLLIEADLRTPGLSARLRAADGSRPGWTRSPGLGEGGWPAGLQVPIDAGESGSFDLVPGRRVRNVARALTSASATRLIAEADAPALPSSSSPPRYCPTPTPSPSPAVSTASSLSPTPARSTAPTWTGYANWSAARVARCSVRCCTPPRPESRSCGAPPHAAERVGEPVATAPGCPLPIPPCCLPDHRRRKPPAWRRHGPSGHRSRDGTGRQSPVGCRCAAFADRDTSVDRDRSVGRGR